MTTANKIAATMPIILEAGTVVVHNYGEFTHGVITEHVGNGMYKVFFPEENCPNTAKYKVLENRIRTLRHNAGFFVSRFDTLDNVKKAQKKYKKSGLALES